MNARLQSTNTILSGSARASRPVSGGLPSTSRLRLDLDHHRHGSTDVLRPGCARHAHPSECSTRRSAPGTSTRWAPSRIATPVRRRWRSVRVRPSRPRRDGPALSGHRGQHVPPRHGRFAITSRKHWTASLGYAFEVFHKNELADRSAEPLPARRELDLAGGTTSEGLHRPHRRRSPLATGSETARGRRPGSVGPLRMAEKGAPSDIMRADGGLAMGRPEADRGNPRRRCRRGSRRARRAHPRLEPRRRARSWAIRAAETLGRPCCEIPRGAGTSRGYPDLPCRAAV